MNSVRLLDCTLRDGGYCNQWRFGYDNTKKIVNKLIEANIEIIECGFITERVVYDPNVTKFNSARQAAAVIPKNRQDKLFVAMLNYGEFCIEKLENREESGLDGIRIAFHKKDVKEALEYARRVKEKGYVVFIQAMVSMSYSDEEFLSLIQAVNAICPAAFYIVDSFGAMKSKDLTRLFYLADNNLNESICIGFHSHNNTQLSFSNAQRLTTMQTSRDLIIDCSIYGMGRGAGNLNTELFVDYLNENTGKKYRLEPLLTVIDEILNDFYIRNYWGYSLPNYISAVHNAHPNYAGYLDERKTLTFESMNEIFDLMDDEKKVEYDRSYIESLYLQYMEKDYVQESHKTELMKRLNNRDVLIIGPGKSSVDEKEKIIRFVSEHEVTVISINFAYDLVNPDFIFISNLRRFRELKKENISKSLITSNISCDDAYYQIKFRDLVNSEDSVRDNAALMAIKFLITCGVKNVFLAGIDGYSHDKRENYGKDEMAYFATNALFDSINQGMCKVLSQYSTYIHIHFITTEKYVKLEA